MSAPVKTESVTAKAKGPTIKVWRNPNGTLTALGYAGSERIYLGENAKILDRLFGVEDAKD